MNARDRGLVLVAFVDGEVPSSMSGAHVPYRFMHAEAIIFKRTKPPIITSPPAQLLTLRNCQSLSCLEGIMLS